MTDPNLITQTAPVVAPAIKHVVHHVAPHLPAVKSGVSMLVTIFSSIASAAVAGVAGFYVSKLNLFSKAQTVQATVTKDVTNAKAEVSKLESEVTHSIHVG